MSGQTEQLEHETESARTELVSLLDALRDRLTPREIVEEAMDYARDTRVGEFARNLRREVQDHPLPLIVVFAGIAWACIATALRSQRRRDVAGRVMAPAATQEMPDPMTTPAASFVQESNLFVAHEGWGVERVRESVE
jgi:uncharacterized protein DUF3618